MVQAMGLMAFVGGVLGLGLGCWAVCRACGAPRPDSVTPSPGGDYPQYDSNMAYPAD